MVDPDTMPICVRPGAIFLLDSPDHWELDHFDGSHVTVTWVGAGILHFTKIVPWKSFFFVIPYI